MGSDAMMEKADGSTSHAGRRWSLALAAALLGTVYAAGADAQSFLDRLKNTAEKALDKKAEQVIDDTLSGQPAAEPAPPPKPAEQPKLKLGTSSGGRNCGALGAGCADGMNDLVSCMNRGNARHYGELLAPALQKKLDAGVLAAGTREDLEFDIAAVKAAAAPPYGKVQAADPSKPHRYLSWLTPQEQADIMNDSNRYNTELQKECNEKYARF